MEEQLNTILNYSIIRSLKLVNYTYHSVKFTLISMHIFKHCALPLITKNEQNSRTKTVMEIKLLNNFAVLTRNNV